MTKRTISVDGAPTQFRSDVHTAIEILKGLGAGKIYLFGSILSPDRTPEVRGIDIAVDGLPKYNYFQAYDLFMMQSEHKFDLVDLDGRGSFVRHLMESGNFEQVT